MAPFAVHVDSLPPVRPWMKIMLGPMINSNEQNVAVEYLLSHRIDSVRVYYSEA